MGTVSARRRLLWSTFAGEVAGPIVHEPPPPLEQVRAGVGRLDRILDSVRQRRLDDFARMVRLLGRPVPEAGSESVRHAGDAAACEQKAQLRDNQPPAAPAREHERAVAERPRGGEDRQRPPAQRDPVVAGYFAWKRAFHLPRAAWLAVPFATAAVVANVYPFTGRSDTGLLMILHLPIALWLVVGVAYVGRRWWAESGRMDFVRFSGELFIYYVLIAMGGGVLIGFTLMMFAAIDVDAEWLAQSWMIPCGAAGAVIVSSWLVEAKQSVIENMAPVLTHLFTPLFTLLLLAFLGTMAWTGNPIDVQREVLIAFDLLLVVVVGLVLYAVSAREPDAAPTAFDRLQLLLVVSVLLVDALALAAIAARITEFGFTPNRVAALGENLILLVNLAWSVPLYARFLRGQGEFAALERWQVTYLPVYAAWAVVIVFPPLFGFA